MARVEIPDLHNLLVLGVDSVSLAASAKKAGYQVFAVDHFGDRDLKSKCQETLSTIEQKPGRSCGHLSSNFSPEALLQLTKALLKRCKIDAVLLSSGLDDSSKILFKLNELVPILGNHPRIIEEVRDKTEFFNELRRIGISHPETVVAGDLEEARKKSKDIGYPVVLKPLKGFGGADVRRIENSRELKRAFRETSRINKRVLIQKYISGTNASASLISCINGAFTLTLNRQLVGVHELGQREPFGYSGNIVPLVAIKKVVDGCKSAVEKITQHFGLVGSNGIDFVISEEGIPYVIEVNPRFQGTLECVERVLGMNLVKAHVKACVQRVLPTMSRKPSFFCGRFIVFALQRSVAPELGIFEGVSDIPIPGVVLERGEPLCSLIIKGANKEHLLQKARETAKAIWDSCDYIPVNSSL